MRFFKSSMICLTLVLAMGTVTLAETKSTTSKNISKNTKTTTVNSKEDDLADNILTVDEATQRAISYSKDLKTLKENLSVAVDDAKDTNKDLFYASDYTDVKNYSVQLKNLYNRIENYKANEEITKQSIELSIIQYFSSIKNAENNIKLYEEELEIAKKQLEISAVKLNLGLISQTDYNDQKNSYDKTNSQLISLENSLTDAYTSLNKLLGYDLTAKYDVELDIDYSDMEDVDLDEKIDSALSTKQSIKELKNSVDIAKYELDVYSSLYSNEKKESKQNAYAQAGRDLTDAENDLKQTLTNLYDSIKSSESSYKNNIADLEQLKKEFEIKQVQLSLGKTTELEVQRAKYNIDSLEAQIEAQVYSHEISVRKFQNPDLI